MVSKFNQQWAAAFEDYRAYMKQHGREPSCEAAAPEDKRMGRWGETQRLAKTKCILSAERIARLDVIGFVWDPLGELWQKNYAHYVYFIHMYGREPYVSAEAIEEKRLAMWVSTQRKTQLKGVLSTERTHLLESVGFVFNHFNDLWNKGFSDYLSFTQRHDYEPPSESASPEEKRLSKWAGKQRYLRVKNNLSLDRVARLDTIGFVWNPLGDGWDKNFAKYGAFIQQHGRGPSTGAAADQQEKSLARWGTKQRIVRRDGELDKIRADKLRAIGFNFHPNTSQTKWDALLRSTTSLCASIQDGSTLTPADQKTVHWLRLQLEDFVTLDVVQQAHIQALADSYPGALKQFGLSFSTPDVGIPTGP